MNFFKNTLLIATLFAINAMDARDRGAVAQQPQTPQTPASAPQKQSAPGAVNYSALRKEIMNMGAAAVIDTSNNLLKDSFLKTIRSRVADKREFELFLQIARDKYLPLIGNDTTDLQRLQAINKQIQNVVSLF